MKKLSVWFDTALLGFATIYPVLYFRIAFQIAISPLAGMLCDNGSCAHIPSVVWAAPLLAVISFHLCLFFLILQRFGRTLLTATICCALSWLYTGPYWIPEVAKCLHSRSDPLEDLSIGQCVPPSLYQK
jgi:hypothetical protein